ncbi:MAG: hypothetical protein FWC18_00455 [Cystobacterineae bacterium]|nr:hypothetical protein [Cystobacterineae bacterium]
MDSLCTLTYFRCLGWGMGEIYNERRLCLRFLRFVVYRRKLWCWFVVHIVRCVWLHTPHSTPVAIPSNVCRRCMELKERVLGRVFSSSTLTL